MTGDRLLPHVWAFTVRDLETLTRRPMGKRSSHVLIDDVEGLIRGAITDGQRRGVLHRDLEDGDFQEVLGFLLGEVAVHGRKFVPQPGIEFRPWLYYRLTRYGVPDAARWLYGRRGQHRLLPGQPDADADAPRGDRLGDVAGVDEADRVDARRWLSAEGDRGPVGCVGDDGGVGGATASGGDRGAGARVTPAATPRARASHRVTGARAAA